ncbi:MAG TPA: DNA polymerase IV [Candidatus Limnocylindrales bacterium]|nr:DNA polymerase IV [Candidatus Limnocylindrales bacterium]
MSDSGRRTNVSRGASPTNVARTTVARTPVAPKHAQAPRTILHVDLDAFFAAVEQRDDPALRGKPVVVGMGGPNDRGVVAAASYEARAFGVHSALPIRTAKRLCPDCVFVPVRGAVYARVSREVMAILRRFTPLVEPISIDEAFMDVTASQALFGDGESIARQVKAAIRDELSLTASVGVAMTKLVAKIGSDLRKPDGLVVVAPGEEAAFLAPLPIARLWGVGPSTAAALRDFGVATIGDLQALDRSALARRLGQHGAALVDRAHGLDPDPVDDPDAAKSIGHEHTFDEDTADRDVIERTFLAMAEGVSARLRDAGAKASTVTVKIRDSGFNTITRQRRLVEPTDLTEPIWHAALELARPELRGKRIRLVGVTASSLGERDQLSLFDGLDDERRRRAVEAADELRHRYGTRAVTRARLIRTGLPAPFERDLGTAVERRGRFDSRGGTGRKHRPVEPGAPLRDGSDDGFPDDLPEALDDRGVDESSP